MELHKKNIKKRSVTIDDLIDLPIINNPNWTEDEINNELENNIQGILGYVVKWVNNGIGCSKVLDINNIGLMEDRATLRISSQHIQIGCITAYVTNLKFLKFSKKWL